MGGLCNTIELHLILHKRLFSHHANNQPVLLVSAIHQQQPLQETPIRHYDPRSLGEILFNPYVDPTFDVFVRKIHSDDSYLFDDMKVARLLRYPRRFEYIVFGHLGKTGLLPVESASSAIWKAAEMNAGKHYVYRMDINFA